MISVETISRRGFLAAGAVGAAMVGVGGFGAVSRQADAAFVRPPGAESNAQLVAACDRCGRCLQACPYGIVTPVPLAENLVAYGTPTLAFDHGCCDFCMQCVDACPTGALAYGGPRERDLGVAVVVKDACVAWDWAGCTVCKDECPVEGAITLDDHDRPVVHPEYCDGCGAGDGRRVQRGAGVQAHGGRGAGERGEPPHQGRPPRRPRRDARGGSLT